MKKKVILLISVLVCMVALCSCGVKSSNEESYNGYSSGDLQSACEQTGDVLAGLSQQEAVQYYSYYASQEDGEKYADLMKQWLEIQPEVGDFVGYKDFEVTKAGKTLSAVETMAFSQRDVTLTYVFNANTMEITAVNVQIVYSLGETMAKAGLNTLMGISIVFTILVLICLIIYCFNIIPILQEKFAKDKAPKSATQIVTKEREIPVEEEQVDDLELIAVIAAAIAMETGASTDDFVVRSIKRRY